MVGGIIIAVANVDSSIYPVTSRATRVVEFIDTSNGMGTTGPAIKGTTCVNALSISSTCCMSGSVTGNPCIHYAVVTSGYSGYASGSIAIIPIKVTIVTIMITRIG
jgi:hypothetical protein